MASIIIAEDDMPMRAVMTRLLETAGHKVWPVADGHEAAAALKKHKCELLLTIRALELPLCLKWLV